MKILLVCVHFHSSFGWSIDGALRRAGQEVQVFEYRRPPVDGVPGWRRWWSRRWMPAALAAAARRFRPDLLFLAKGEAVPGSVLEALRRETGCRAVNWFPDGRLFAQENVLAQMPFLDFLFSKNRLDLDRLKLLGFHNGRFLQHCADRELHLEYKPDAQALEPYRCEVALVGARYAYREAIAVQLLDYELKIWGAGWQGSDLQGRKPRAVVGREARSFEQARVFRGAAVNLNTHHYDDLGSLNQRVFDIAGSAGCQLVDGSRPVEEIFEVSRDLEVFCSAEELREKVAGLLLHPDQARDMGVRAQSKVAAGHTYDHRIAEILDMLHA